MHRCIWALKDNNCPPCVPYGPPLDAYWLSVSPKENNEVDDSIDMPWHVLVSTPCCLKAKQMVWFLSFSFLRWVTFECDFSLLLLMFSFNTRGEGDVWAWHFHCLFSNPTLQVGRSRQKVVYFSALPSLTPGVKFVALSFHLSLSLSALSSLMLQNASLQLTAVSLTYGNS